jgi:diguanylate cyclase (GGDEF)-like protein/PAS domain S-box-containing protein
MHPAPSEDGKTPPANAGGEGGFGAESATSLFELSPLGVLLSDAEGRCIYTNAAFRRITGSTVEQALGVPWSLSVHPDDRQRASEEWADAVQRGEPFRAEVRFQHPDGAITWVRLNAGTDPGACGQSANLLMVEDISERKAAERIASDTEEALFAEKERAQVTLDSIGDAVLVTDLAGKLTYMNLEAETLTGWSSETALGRSLADVFRIVDGETRRTAPDPARRAIEEDQTVGLAVGCILVRRDGSEVAIEDSAAPIHGRDGAVTGAVIVFHSVAHSRAEAERMSYLAKHDQLTGLVRPAQLTERLTQAIGQAHRHGRQVGLLFIDLNRFKEINDEYGHDAGDHVLKAIAARLSSCVRETDTVCRRGGDEFLILLPEIEGQQDAARVADKVLAALADPHALEGATVYGGASIGISVYPEDGRDAATLLRFADTAMYRAKKSSTDGSRYAAAGHFHSANGWRHDAGKVARRPRRRMAVASNQLQLKDLT